MTRKLILPLLVALLAATGCSTISTQYDYDSDAPFDTYRTYAWLPPPEPGSGSAQAAMQGNDLVNRRIKSAVDRHIQTRGLTLDQNSDTPDLLVTFHTGVQDKVNVQDWGYSYGGPYGGYYGRDIDVYTYQQGTLIVDLIDRAARQLVWRGVAQKTLSDNPSPQESESTIDAAVQKIFQQYPPR